MIFEIILTVVIVIQTYVVINLMIKTEKLETLIENFENQLTQSIEEINEIDDKGYFESDDEAGTKFKQITEIVNSIQTLRGDNDNNV